MTAPAIIILCAVAGAAGALPGFLFGRSVRTRPPVTLGSPPRDARGRFTRKSP